jgi:hypothetical protein
MKLIITATELEKEFSRLLKQYKKYYWTTAWAGESLTLFRGLIANKNKIEKITVGIHFYQTHPDFIRAFIDSEQVKFIKQPSGTFHPKLYLFYNDNNSWELLIGSANFTNGAFTKNTEATTLIKSDDSNTNNILKTAFELINKSWNKASIFTKPKFDEYNKDREKCKPKIKDLNKQYEGLKIFHKPPIAIKSWDEFINDNKMRPSSDIKERLKVISECKKMFYKVDHFKDFKEDERRYIAGIPNNYNQTNYWEWFGNMRGSGIFKNKIIKNDLNISKALDQIPLEGKITKRNYDNFVKHFTKTFAGNCIAIASRLLAMKRPDTFVCLNSMNKRKLCEDFKIKQYKMTFDRYWEDIIETIYNSNWWTEKSILKNGQDRKIKEAKAAFLDVLYFTREK